MNTDYFELEFDTNLSLSRKKLRIGPTKRRQVLLAEEGFRCAHCHAYVVSHPILSGVQHRNHCPYCLWSRHLDLYQAGDRMAACKSPMQPVGMSMKREMKRYGPSNSGELMIVHRCLDCEKISANRIAADDDPDRMLEVFTGSFHLESELREQMASHGILILGASQTALVRSRLFGSCC